MKYLLMTALLLTPLDVLHAADRTFDSPDIVIYGATPAGIAAALNAAEGDRSVWLVEPTGRIGGMMTHGLSHSDFHSFESAQRAVSAVQSASPEALPGHLW